MSKGCVYILTSANSEFIKIGGTDFAPMKRIREINSTEPYRSLGPWSLHDFREVSDWRAVEYGMHYAFRSKLSRSPSNQKELFRLAPRAASAHLCRLEPETLIRKPILDRTFQDEDFGKFLDHLFAFTGLLSWLDVQGAWSFVLFPSTAGGRYYTINIGRHEVAFAALPDSIDQPFYHSIVMDRLIRDFPKVKAWIRRRNGKLREGVYTSAMPRATSVGFFGDFEDASEFLRLDGVRRALIAYWTEALIRLKERGVTSAFSRHHNWNAVAELRRRAIAAAV